MTEAEDTYVYVSVSEGELRGREKISNGFTKVKYFSFLGIPYAKPPVGELRFKEPQPVEPWTGVRNALQEGANSPQRHIFSYHEIGDEDCLYLNVFSKKLSAKSEHLKPVMVYIHAGGFTSGSGDTEVYGPDFLIEHDIVLVTFNFRLGALGFLSLENNDLPGNAGLKDQVFALEWVKKNIRQFGGDPDNVTIFGISSGGASVEYHLLSPLSKGLFHRAIMQSGSVLNPWAYHDNPRKIAICLAKNLGYTDDLEDSNKIIEFFRNVPAMTLVKGQYDVLSEKEKLHTLELPVRPCVEKEGPGKQFITRTPREILDSGDFTRVPLIIGSTSNEGNLTLRVKGLLNEIQFDQINKDSDWLVPMDINIPVDKKVEISREIKKFYFDGKPLSWKNTHKLEELFGDLCFNLGLADSLSLMLQKSGAPVYKYNLSYENKRSILKLTVANKFPNLVVKGTPHGDDIPLLFKQGTSFPDIPIPPNDEIVIKKMTKMWTTFAKTGNPNFKELDSIWEATDATNMKYFDIGNEFIMLPGRLHEKRLKFWEGIYDKYKHAAY